MPVLLVAMPLLLVAMPLLLVVIGLWFSFFPPFSPSFGHFSSLGQLFAPKRPLVGPALRMHPWYIDVSLDGPKPVERAVLGVSCRCSGVEAPTKAGQP